jgi:enoyl-CoA hydratase/carnithine racemase
VSESNQEGGANVELVVESDQGILVLRINRPQARNALSPAVVRELGAAVLAADSDTAVQAVVIAGTGDRAFCAGMDLRAFTQEQPEPDFDRDYVRFLQAGIGKPVIAAVNATAVAGGFELMLACDLVVASTEAKFGLPEVKRGLFPAGGGTTLARRIPTAAALELGLTGDYISSARAYELGLVNRLCAPETVLDDALSLARVIAGNGPLAVRITKRLMLDAQYCSQAQAWQQRDGVFDEVFGSADAREGANAFVEKRDPQWTGN